jgi:hypothetical protein
VLRDLEEVLNTIPDVTSREYMAEAIRCYHAGAYRAAVALAMAAAMDDFRRKLAGLTSTPELKEASRQVEEKFKNHQPFENLLIDQSSQLGFEQAEAWKLKKLLDTRNKCAHPSGHRSSPEEARDCIVSLIDLVMARPLLMGVPGVLALLKRAREPYFFPSIANDDNCVQVVKCELERIHPTLLPVLARKLTEAILEESPDLTPGKAAAWLKQHLSPVRENLRAFAASMLRAGTDARGAMLAHVGMLVENENVKFEVLEMLKFAPDSLKEMEPLSKLRTFALVRRNVTTDPAGVIVAAWIKSRLLETQEIDELLSSCKDIFKCAPKLETLRRSLNWPELDLSVFSEAVGNAGSTQFAVANPSIEIVQAMTTQEAASLPPEFQVTYLLNVALYSRGPFPTRKAAEIVGSGLGTRVDFLGAFESALKTNQEFKSQRTDWSALTIILTKSGRPELIKSLLEVFSEKVESELQIRKEIESAITEKCQ